MELKRPSSSRRDRPCILLFSLPFSLSLDRWSLLLLFVIAKLFLVVLLWFPHRSYSSSPFHTLSVHLLWSNVEQHGTTWNRSKSVELKRPSSSKRDRHCILLLLLSLSLPLDRWSLSPSLIRHCQTVLGRSFVVSSSFSFSFAFSHTCTALSVEQRGTTWNNMELE